MENNLNTPDSTFNSGLENTVNTTINPTEFSNIKTIGGLAALFAAASIIPYIGFLLSLASIVLFLIAFQKISVLSGNKSIFNNIGFSYLIAFVGAIVLISVFAFLFLDFFREMIQMGDIDEEYLAYMIESVKEEMLSGIISVFIFYYVIAITFAYLWKLSLDKTAVFFNDNAFKTAGILYIIGAATIIVCGLGILINLAANIVLAVAFFSLKQPQTK